jgi:hypothetical protein
VVAYDPNDGTNGGYFYIGWLPFAGDAAEGDMPGGSGGGSAGSGDIPSAGSNPGNGSGGDMP